MNKVSNKEVREKRMSEVVNREVLEWLRLVEIVSEGLSTKGMYESDVEGRIILQALHEVFGLSQKAVHT